MHTNAQNRHISTHIVAVSQYRRMEVQHLVASFETKLKCIEQEIDVLKEQNKQEGLQWEACSQLVQQI